MAQPPKRFSILQCTKYEAVIRPCHIRPCHMLLKHSYWACASVGLQAHYLGTVGHCFVQFRFWASQHQQSSCMALISPACWIAENWRKPVNRLLPVWSPIGYLSFLYPWPWYPTYPLSPALFSFFFTGFANCHCSPSLVALTKGCDDGPDKLEAECTSLGLSCLSKMLEV